MTSRQALFLFYPFNFLPLKNIQELQGSFYLQCRGV